MAMQYPFTKMQGAGNDFVVFDGFSQSVELTPQQIRRIADRRFGVGCDQILLLSPGADNSVSYLIYNADGSESMQCGNGARCAAAYLREKGLVVGECLELRTGNGSMSLRFAANGEPQVEMPAPRFEPADIPLVVSARAQCYSVEFGGAIRRFSALSMGNPHAVFCVPDVETAQPKMMAAALERSKLFPEGVNTGCMQILNRREIHVRVYERGAGETLSCGSGACAAVVAGCQSGDLDAEVAVRSRGGTLHVSWEGEGQSVFLQGAVATVFKGQIDLKGV
ncbi:MAG: diaminopimelate epimerase [Candidatus Eutrophobiaceae bacterium]